MTIEETISSVIAARIQPLVEELRRVSGELTALRRALPPQLMSMREAAAQLGVSLSTVRRQVKSGELPCRRIGRAVRVDLSRGGR